MPAVARRVSSPSFVGRAAQLTALRDALGRAGSGVSGVVLVSGESGVGKSRLLSELAGFAQEGGALVLRGDCIELGEGELPYAPIVGALRHLTRVVDAATLDRLLPAARNELGRLVPELIPGAAPIGEPSQTVLFEGVLALLARLADDQPVLLVLEDVHWADQSTRDLFAFLGRNLRDERVLVIATFRSDELHRRHPVRGLLAELERLPKTERIDLMPLSLSEAEQQIAGILGQAPSAELAQRVHARSEGNPFFVEELVAAGAEGPLPDSLRGALMLRVEPLSEDAQRVLRVLATAGRPVSDELLAVVLPGGDDALSAPLRDAVNRNIVSVTGEGTFRFRHALYGEAIYDDLLPGERAGLHRALADALAGHPALAVASESIGAAELAHHWYAAHALPAALAAAVKAGYASRAAGAMPEAARQFGTALELWDQVPDAEALAGVAHAVLVRQAGEAAHLIADYERGAALLTQAALAFEAQGDYAAAGLAQTRLGRCLSSAGRTDAALAAHARAVELMPAAPTAGRAEALALRARALMLSDRVAESVPLAEEALTIARAVGARAEEGHALNTLGVDVAQLGDRERGIEYLREALEIAKALGDPDELGSAYVNLSDRIDQGGRIEEAAELGIEGIEACEQAGVARVSGAFLSSEVALRLIRLGRYEEADRLVTKALQLNPGGLPEAALHQTRAQLLIERGDPELAPAELEPARDLTERTNDSMWIGPFAATEVEAALWCGDPDTAAMVAERGLSRLGDAFFVSATAPLHANALRAEADRLARQRAMSQTAAPGRTDELLQGLAALLATKPGPEVHAWVALARAEAERAKDHAPAAAYGAAADLFDELAMPFRTAYARMREVEAALEDGVAGRDVADRLGQARTLASDIGAPLLLAEIEALARRARVPLATPDKERADADDASPAQEDPFGLTPREAEVLVLMAQGHTNREIGQRLFISNKTASVHVSRILAKLSARNRGEAAAIAHRLGLTQGPENGAAQLG
jgi:DNA-binding CsgD family transcriptional regulator/tetratricopeptide (TPR) repeat protein